MRLELGSEREGKRIEKNMRYLQVSDSVMPQERHKNAW